MWSCAVGDGELSVLDINDAVGHDILFIEHECSVAEVVHILTW